MKKPINRPNLSLYANAAIGAKKGVDALYTVRNLSIEDVRQVALARMSDYWRTSNGWLDSHVQNRPIDERGNPVPWITYACRRFLEPRLAKTMRVFEYGSGHSTLYFASRVGHVVSCERNEGFYNEIKPQLPKNVTYILEPDIDESYIQSSLNHGGNFDLIMVDYGTPEVRVASGLAARKALSPGGCILWDNSDMRHAEMLRARKEFAETGFRCIDFQSHGPILRREWVTSIFYRDGNCLEI